MALMLHLGVVDVPYAGKTAGAFETTGDVAEKLERDYGVMEHFFDWHAEEIVGDLEDGLRGALESFAMGAPVQLAPFGSGISKIEERFRNFLSLREMDMRLPGVPTVAAQHGVSHRFKHPNARRAPRPSFIDTGLYEASMKAWID